MKTDAQIRRKIQQVLFRYRKRFVQEGLARIPTNCRFNEQVKTPEGKSNFGTCRFVDSNGHWNNVVCDVSFQGCELAKNCSYFKPRHSSESLKAEFRRRWQTGSLEIGTIAREFPDVAALMWVLAPSQPENDVLGCFGGGEDDQ